MNQKCIEHNLKDTCRWSCRAKMNFKCLTSSAIKTYQSCPQVHEAISMRTFYRQLRVGSPRMGVCLPSKQTDMCEVETLWDQTIQKRVHKMVIDFMVGASDFDNLTWSAQLLELGKLSTLADPDVQHVPGTQPHRARQRHSQRLARFQGLSRLGGFQF